jgi:hypothetical protein
MLQIIRPAATWRAVGRLGKLTADTVHGDGDSSPDRALTGAIPRRPPGAEVSGQFR